MYYHRTVLLSLGLLLCVPTAEHAFAVPAMSNGAKNALVALGVAPVLYYFFHRPEPRPSRARIERVFTGRLDNVVDDIFNWSNIENFKDIIPGQRWKVYAYKFNGESGARLKIPYPGHEDIKGHGFIHFCEKQMGKICKSAAFAAILYALLHGKFTAENLEQLIGMLLKALNSPLSEGVRLLEKSS